VLFDVHDVHDRHHILDICWNDYEFDHRFHHLDDVYHNHHHHNNYYPNDDNVHDNHDTFNLNDYNHRKHQ